MKEVIKILICGSVDDGKSTLLGKLMYDKKLAYQDQIKEVENESKKYGTQGNNIDLALLSDGLQAEREQGITIDVANKYFFYKKKKFIIADTPGHVEYTRNLATGASNSDYAIILIDASKGVLPHTKLCSLISSIFRMKQILVVINKMDLVNYNKTIYDNHCKSFIKFTEILNYKNVDFLPISALKGENISKKSKKMRWYNGLSFLDKVELFSSNNNIDQNYLRIGIQLVNRNSVNRLYCGQIFTGELKKNDKIIISPSNETNIVKEIFSSKGKVNKIRGDNFVSLILKKNTDLNRGNFLSYEKNQIKNYNLFNAHLICLEKSGLSLNQKFKIKFILNECEAKLDFISYKFERKNFQKIKSDKLEVNEIGLCKISMNASLAVEKFSNNKKIGSFIIIDLLNNKTIGAGVIESLHEKKNTEIFWQHTDNKNNLINSQKPLVLWFTGLSASGKSTIANLVNKKLNNSNKKTYLLDGDNLRHGLCRDLGFSDLDRRENIRRAAELSKIISDMGFIVMSCFISPFKEERLLAKTIVEENKFIEIYCKASIKTCEKRDKKGLYKKARKGILKNFTGISSIYEKPIKPDLILDSDNKSPSELAENVIKYLRKNELI